MPEYILGKIVSGLSAKKERSISMKHRNFTHLRKIAVLLICAIFAACVSGCSMKFGTTPKDSDIVAKPANDSSPELEVTFGDFNKQYQYYLKANDIDDDTSAENLEDCKTHRTDIINNMTMNRVYMQKARELGLDTLSDEDMAVVDEEYESQINSLIEYYGKKELGVDTSSDSTSSENSSSADNSDSSSSSESTDSAESSPTEDEIKAKGGEVLDAQLKECGLTRDDLHRWLEEYLISANVLDELLKSVTRESAEEVFEEMLTEMEAIYNSDSKALFFQSGYYKSWLPDGSRMIKQVLLGFDEDTQTQLETLRGEGKDDEADALREEKAAEFTDKIAEVEQKLDDNEDFTTILVNYSSDVAGSTAYPDGYLVLPGDTRYIEEFVEAAFIPEKVGDRTLCTSDYGVHIMIYASDAETDDEFNEAVIDNILGQMRSEEAEKLIEQWETEYDYQIDYEKLRIDPASV